MLLLQWMYTQFCNSAGINFSYSSAFSVVIMRIETLIIHIMLKIYPLAFAGDILQN